jgi:hypothetical protein
MVETDKDVEAQQSAELFDLGTCCSILHGAACLPAVFLLLRVEWRIFCRCVRLLMTFSFKQLPIPRSADCDVLTFLSVDAYCSIHEGAVLAQHLRLLLRH